MKNVALLSLLLPMLLVACSPKDESALTIRDAWARPAQAGEISAAYFVIENPGSADALLGASVSIAEAAEMHMTTIDADSTSSMRHHMQMDIPARENLEFAPGGRHIMLINLSQALNPGDHFTLILSFKNAGDLEVEVEVRE